MPKASSQRAAISMFCAGSLPNIPTVSRSPAATTAFAEVEVYFRREEADAALDVPDAFAGAASAVEDGDVVAVRLRIVGADEAQQRTFSRPVRAEQRPAFAVTDCPVDVVEDDGFAVAHTAIVQ